MTFACKGPTVPRPPHLDLAFGCWNYIVVQSTFSLENPKDVILHLVLVMLVCFIVVSSLLAIYLTTPLLAPIRVIVRCVCVRER